MEKQRFEILLDGIRVGNYPPSLGYTITVDQFLRIHAVCGHLVTQLPPGDSKGISLITQYLMHWKTKVDDIVELEKRLSESLKAKIGLFDVIHKVIDAYQSDDTKDCILLVHGDKVNQKARFQIYGDVQSMAMTFAALLDNENSDFKRFIFSLLGVYLSKNPEDHKSFMNGIELAKQSFGIN